MQDQDKDGKPETKRQDLNNIADAATGAVALSWVQIAIMNIIYCDGRPVATWFRAFYYWVAGTRKLEATDIHSFTAYILYRN